MNRARLFLWLGSWVVAGVIGMAAHAWLFPAPAPVVEKPAPAVVQKDQSIVIERAAPQPKRRAPHALPKNTRLERGIEIAALGQGVALPPDAANLPVGTVLPCPPVTLDLSLVREADGARRVVASSPDGTITRALDIPVDAPPISQPARRHRWGAGLSWSAPMQTPGVWVDRDLGRLRLGLEINQTRERIGGLGVQSRGIEARVKVGVTW